MVWEIESGDMLRNLGSVEEQTWGMAFHPTEPLLLVGGWGGGVKLWNAESGEELVALEARGGGIVWQLDFSPDGAYFALSGSDAPAQLYKTDTGELVSILTDYPFGALQFTPDNTIVSSFFNPDGPVREITVFLADALALAGERITRDLTKAECLQYLRSADCVVDFASQ
ncbi:MAG: WD40 repeat domain-containing protein [Chloroflexota bacterium]